MSNCCGLSIVPIRKDPSDRSEIVSQLLFGEFFEIKETLEKWVRIVSLHDQYEGWIDRKQAHAVSSVSVAKNPLPHPQFYEGQFFSAGCFADITDVSTTPASLEQVALSYLNSPYLWGGKTHAGIDCSGLTQMVYRLMGVTIPRDAHQQAEMGQIVSFVEEAQTGDLAFFDNEEGRIIHVGLIIKNPQGQFPSIIHASGWVRKDTLDNEGIKKENGEQSHRLRIIKRI